MASKTCCRDEIINNIASPEDIAIIVNIEINEFAYLSNNNSPAFIETTFLSFCANESIDYAYQVDEPDGDQLIYKFCTPLGENFPQIGFLKHPPWPTVDFLLPTYATNYPLGQGGLLINPSTGQLTGTPQIIGNFSVGICVEEYRNGFHIGTIRQDIAINVVPCTPLLTADIAAENTDAQNRAIYQLCNENTLTIQNLSSPPESIIDYEWYIEYPDAPLVSDDENPTFTFDRSGQFYGHLVINPDSLCNDTAFFVVEVSSISTDFLMNYDTCEAGPVIFTSNTINNATIAQHIWNFGDDRIALGKNPVHYYETAGTFDVQLKVTDVYGCADTVKETLTWQPAPRIIVVSPDVAAGCTPLVTTIQDRSQPVDSTYHLYWEFGNGNIAAGLTATNTYHEAGNYDVYLSITSPIGCFTDTVFENLISADLPPVANFSWTPSADFDRFTEFEFIDSSERALNWNWIFDTLSQPDIRRAPIYNFPDTGYHNVILIVEDQYGCFDTLTQGIDIMTPQTYFLPNAFTPNGDGLNDEFIGIGLTDYIQDFRMDIFDRWGGLIFTSQDIRKGWTGSNVPTGMYVYKVRYRMPNSEWLNITGEVVLVR